MSSSHKVSTDASISQFLPSCVRDAYACALGPGFEYHVESELKTRNPTDYVLLDDVEPDAREDQAKINSVFFIENCEEITKGRNILNRNTLAALYIWSPGIHIRHILAENPDSEIFTVDRDGGVCIVRVGAYNIHSDSLEIRREARSQAIKRERGPNGEFRCDACWSDYFNHPDYVLPPPPKLCRQNAVCITRVEAWQFKCECCSKKITKFIGY